MPRSAGTYSLPANAHAVSGNTISSVYFNNLIDDLANEMTNSLPRDGTAAMTGTLNATAGVAGATFYTFSTGPDTGFYSTDPDLITLKMATVAIGTFTDVGWTGNTTGIFNALAYVDVASATTTDIGAATSNFVNITGTTTITGLGTATAGTLRWIKFAGILTFTHNATSLILPGGANITTAVGDTCVAVSAGEGNWRVLSYHKASGKSVVTGVVSADLPAGTIVNRAYATYATNTDLTTVIPLDDTIPQSTEGTEIVTVSITPKSVTNRLRVRFKGFYCHSSATAGAAVALFQDSATDAIKAEACGTNGASATIGNPMELEHEYVPGTTSAITLKIRVGPNSGTIRMNGSTSGRYFGGVAASTLIVEEIVA